MRVQGKNNSEKQTKNFVYNKKKNSIIKKNRLKKGEPRLGGGCVLWVLWFSGTWLGGGAHGGGWGGGEDPSTIRKRGLTGRVFGSELRRRGEQVVFRHTRGQKGLGLFSSREKTKPHQGWGEPVTFAVLGHEKRERGNGNKMVVGWIIL